MHRKLLPPVLAALFVTVAVFAISRNTYNSWVAGRVEELHAICSAAMKSEDWATLEESSREWLRLDERNGFAWIYLGEAAQRRGDFELTASCLAQVPDDDPKCVPALLELVNLQLAKLNQPLEAVETCRRILSIQPNECTAHQRLTFFYAMTFQFEQMEQQIQRSLQAGCVTTEALIYHVGGTELKFSNGYDVNTQWAAAHAGNELFEVAQALHFARQSGDDRTQHNKELLVRSCQEKYPRNLQIQTYLLERAIDTGDLAALERILSDPPTHAETDNRFWRAKGWLHLTRSELPAAQQAYETALEVNPYDWRTRHQLASVLRRLGRVDRVESVTELALEGKQVERELFQLPNAADLPVDVRSRLISYAKRVGDLEFAAVVERFFTERTGLQRLEL